MPSCGIGYAAPATALSHVMRTPLLSVLLLTAGCHVHHGYVRAAYSDPRAGEVCVETIDRHRLGFACYRDGALHGADASAEVALDWLGDWVQDRDLVDHPNLLAWRQQLVRMQEAANDPAAAMPARLLDASRGFPFATATADCCRRWVGGDAPRAGLLLDRLGECDLGHAAVTEFTALALAASGDDERRAAWVRQLAVGEHRDAALLVARSAPLGPRTGSELLARLEDFPTNARAELFGRAAPAVAADGAEAPRLLAAIDELPSSARGPALLRLLKEPGADAALAREAVRHLDDFRTGDRGAIFGAAGRLLAAAAEPGSGADLAAAVDDLATAQRLPGALGVLDAPGGGRFVPDVLGVIDDFPARDRVRLLQHLLDAARWDPAWEPAFRSALDQVSRSGDRDRLLRALDARDRVIIR